MNPCTHGVLGKGQLFGDFSVRLSAVAKMLDYKEIEIVNFHGIGAVSVNFFS
jgi:hypothetical protein